MATEAQWIKCTDQMPEVWESVLLATKSGLPGINEAPAGLQVGFLYRFTSGRMEFHTDIDQSTLYATHWMPLPAPPSAARKGE